MRLLPFPHATRTETVRRTLRRAVALSALCAGFALLAGCASKSASVADASNGNGDATSSLQIVRNGSLFGFLKPYRVDIQQGNFVSQEMVAQLRPGMSRDQVRFVMGTPLQVDLFHANRWDYDFRLAKGNGELIQSRITVFFKDELLEHYDGGTNLPTEAEYLALIAGSQAGAVPRSPEQRPGSGPSSTPAPVGK
ncbi:outer membrane protein assembly factor BamE [Herbaspirillum sp. RTI4]|uniref:outer membrane protein assembly factor BamE n=1 Tax=Herbaspirillum sp. RTI4 TaxID=3048640 RepID=UPI002AB37215|nr:outer membrane protein assembly factor BamE [Herbaspirillum sp. RTI4]MDY7576855.1 outer membrane protein assembly factor BamE [Herbaspirillum sp. RTI4]MEA9983498.1 outer membrane protein assembly factor BamE [Herbaspirillum sp. RTI4]